MLVGAAREETNLTLPRSSKSNLSNARALQAGPPEKGESCNDVGLALQLLANLSVVPGDSGTLSAPQSYEHESQQQLVAGRLRAQSRKECLAHTKGTATNVGHQEADESCP